MENLETWNETLTVVAVGLKRLAASLSSSGTSVLAGAHWKRCGRKFGWSCAAWGGPSIMGWGERRGIEERIQIGRAVGHDTSLFSRLVLGCIETKVCNQIRIFSGFSRSTKLSSWFFEKVAKFCKKSPNFAKLLRNFRIFAEKVLIFAKIADFFCKISQNFWKFSQLVL